MNVEKKDTELTKLNRRLSGIDLLNFILRRKKKNITEFNQKFSTASFHPFAATTQTSKGDGYFTLDIKVPNGTLTREQLETIGNLSIRYAGNNSVISTGQNIKLKNVNIRNLSIIIKELEHVGLTASDLESDDSFNLTQCPIAGIDPNEIIEEVPFVSAVNQHFLKHKEFFDLPHKLKITITGCPLYCTTQEVNDIGLYALNRSNGHTAFDLWIGGGPTAKEEFAARVGVNIFPEQVIDVIHHISAIFSEYKYRGSYLLPRLKFLLKDWGTEKFLTELENRLGYKLAKGDAPQIPNNSNKAHIGIFRQKESSKYYVSESLKNGSFSGKDMIRVARLARQFKIKRIKLTGRQNLIMPDIPKSARFAVAEGLARVFVNLPLPITENFILKKAKPDKNESIVKINSIAYRIIYTLRQYLIKIPIFKILTGRFADFRLKLIDRKFKNKKLAIRKQQIDPALTGVKVR